MDLQPLLDIAPYSLDSAAKAEVLGPYLTKLTRHHYERCEEYRRMLDGQGFDSGGEHLVDGLPFLPARLFKLMDLRSVAAKDVIKTMTSSGTTGQAVSRIFLDKATSQNQTKALAGIVSSFLGNSRSPMLVIDSEAVLKNRQMFSARGAGILGFSLFGSKRAYALDENMNLKYDEVAQFVLEHGDGRIFLFGFTFIIYKHFIEELRRTGLKLDLANGTLIHGGGWKKLASEALTPLEFRRRLKALCGLDAIHDYYGMVEQTGSIYMECEQGCLHVSVFSDVFIRRAFDFSIAPLGEQGIIQTVSALPESYPGHSLLTEDEGVLLGEDDCPCGRLGKYFRVVGRIKSAELRGCSDTYAEGLE